MIKDVKLDSLREWASMIADEYAPNGQVEVKDPLFANSAVTVDIELERTLAQVLLWPSGMLEFRVLAVESGEDLATEYHEVQANDELVGVLRKVAELMATAEAAR